MTSMSDLDSDIADEDHRNAVITTITLDISNKHLKEVPKTIKKFSNIEFLYLSTNDIKSIPDNFFQSLPQLKWLDFRHNLLTDLPKSIGQHRELRTLLLQGNSLKKLPIELGNVPGLTGLNIADNPIEYPPKTVIQEGTQKILRYLRLELQSESMLIPELMTQLEELHVTENEGYLGRQEGNHSNNSNNLPHSPAPSHDNTRASTATAGWELAYCQPDRQAAPFTRLASPTRLAMPQRSRTQVDKMRRRAMSRSPDNRGFSNHGNQDRFSNHGNLDIGSPEPLPRSPQHSPEPRQGAARSAAPRRQESTGRLFEFVPMMKPKRSATRCTNNINIRTGRAQERDLHVEPLQRASTCLSLGKYRPDKPYFNNAWPDNLTIRRSN